MAFMRHPYYILMQDQWTQITEKGPASRTFSIPQDRFDEIVMMRYYNMTEEERRAVIGRVLEIQFETGADGIRKASGLSTVKERVMQMQESIPRRMRMRPDIDGMSRETYDGVSEEEMEL